MTKTFIPVCPVCDKPMVTLEWKGVEIDYCLACQGVWLDRGELQNIVGDNASELEER
ncbi:MAG: zf-TFIIB domain-containing protein, partial [Candidatus Sumerlaeaceae bacterium]